MAMTKKDFDALATLVAQTKNKVYGTNNNSGVICATELALRLATICADSNLNFDCSKFLFACGVAGKPPSLKVF